MRRENMEKRLIWPPKVILQTPLGIMRDESGNWLPRDIGRSSQFSNGDVVVQFGDTFDHDSNGDYTGVRDNTCAMIPDINNPTFSKYNRDAKDEVPILITQRPNEFKIPTKFWSFSGIVEVGREEVGNGHEKEVIFHGYTWFKITRMTGMDETYIRMGVAKVEYNSTTRQIKAIRPTPVNDMDGTFQGSYSKPIDTQICLSISDAGSTPPTFPSFGYICALRVGDFIYLYGQTLPEKDIVLARLRISCPTPYTYWTGSSWSPFPQDCRPIMNHIEHGQIFRTKVFGTESAYKYLFVGNSSLADSRVLMARAKSPEGPWDDGWVLNDVAMYNSNPTKPPTGPFIYCIYPHPWAMGFDSEHGMARTGDLMISWSEGGLVGGVLSSVLRFELEFKRTEDPESEPVNRDGDTKWSNGPKTAAS